MKAFNRTFGLADALVVAAFISLLAVQVDKFAADPGVGWHLSTGELIYRTASIPENDPFLSSPLPRPWVSDQWLSDLLVFSVYKAGSWPLVYAVLTAIFALTFALVVLRANLKVSGLALASCFGTLVAFKLGQIHFILRPVIFAFLFFSWVYREIFLIYRRSCSDPAACRNSLRRSFLILPPVFLIWANMHPSFVLGLVLVLIAPLALALDLTVLERRAPAANQGAMIVSLSALFALCLAATLVNPYFYGLHESILSLGASSFFMRLNEEWMSPDFREYSGRLFEFSLALVAFSLFVSGNKKTGWGFFELLLLVVFGHFALQSVRMLPFFGIAASIPITEALANFSQAPIFKEWQPARRLAAALGNLERREQRTLNGSVLTAVFVFLIVAGAACGLIFYTRPAAFGPPQDQYPFAALDFVKRNLPAGQSAVIAARPDWGGFITWQGGGRLKAIIDDRNTLLGEGFYRDFFENLRPGGHWREFLRQFKTTHLLLESKSPLAASILECGALDVLYRDEIAILFAYGSAR